MEAIRPGSTSEPQVPKPLALYEVIPDDLFDEELYEEPVPRPPEEYEEYELYDDVSPRPPEEYIELPKLPPRPPPLPAADYEHVYDTPPPEPIHQELYVPELYAYFDPDEQPAAQDPPIPTRQVSVSGSEYLSLLTTDHTDEDSYMGLIYEPPLPPPPLQPPPPPVQPPPVAKDHSSLAQRALQYLDPAQLDIMIQMLQKLKGEPGPTAVPRPPSPLPMKKDDDLYEDIYSMDLSSAASSILQKELPPPPPPPDRLVPGKPQFTHKGDPFRKQPSRRLKPAKESNLGRSMSAVFGTLLSAAVLSPFQSCC